MTKATKSVPITSLGDLIDLVNHNSDIFERKIKRLTKSNRGIKVLCVATIGYVIYSAIEAQKREEQIYNLSVRVKKLENGEEE